MIGSPIYSPARRKLAGEGTDCTGKTARRIMCTDYIDLGMIHFIDTQGRWDAAMNGPFLDYVKELKTAGTIRHIGMDPQPCHGRKPSQRLSKYLPG